jgi:hypothetical protein
MKTHQFGAAAFSIDVEDVDSRASLSAHDQIRIRLFGHGWSLGGGADESFGVAIPRLIEFARSSGQRHWGPFAGLESNEAVVRRVMEYGYGSPTGTRSLLHPWDVASALAAYALSALFDSNLGVEVAVLVRGTGVETLIAEVSPGSTVVAEIPALAFDKAIDQLAAWMDQIRGY